MTAPAESRAIVVGASMAGLLAARALSDHFERVTVVDRDVLPEEHASRKGVPQGNHAHGVLASGYRIMDAYFPGMMDELEAAGAMRGDILDQFGWYLHGSWKYRHPSGLIGIAVSRPTLESAVRARVRALPNVTFLDEHDAVEPAFDAGRGRVTGLTVRERAAGTEQTVDADLVVDATGRASQSPKWLESWGFAPPAETVVEVDVGYTTRTFEREPEQFGGTAGAVIAATPPRETRFGFVLAADGPRWVVTLAGVLGDHPPTDEDAWTEWASTLPVPDVHELVRTARPLTPVATYKFPSNRRRHYEKMKRFPEGYLVTGDAICSFNPVYGQGMSVSAMEAKALGEELAAGTDRLAERFFRRAGKLVDIPWMVATGEDFRYPQVAGRRPPGYGVLSRYLSRVQATAATDEVVCRRFMEVTNLLAPPAAVLAPRVMWRTMRPRRLAPS